MKVLVVDDEADIGVLFEQKFRTEIRDKTIEFEFAHSGEDALEYLDKHKGETVLILSDINMPGISGLELLLAVKSKYSDPTPKVILISAYDDDENVSKAKSLGADDFLTKPIDFNILKVKLKDNGKNISSR